MKSTKYFLAVLLTVFCTTGVFAKDVQVSAVGVADDYDWAVLSALENAIRQTVDSKQYNASENVSIFGKGDKKEISAGIKSIETAYKGKIKSYKVVDNEMKDGKYYIALSAIVEKNAADSTSREIIRNSEYSIAIMPFDGLRSYVCSNETISLNSINAELNSILTDKISQTGNFSVINRKDMGGDASETALHESNISREKDKNKLKDLTAADYMLTGTISQFQSSVNSKTIGTAGEKYARVFAKMVVNYSILETATMEVVFSDTIEASFKKEGDDISCKTASNRLFDEVSTNIASDIMHSVFPDFEYQNSEPQIEPSQNTKTVTTTTTKTTQEVIKRTVD